MAKGAMPKQSIVEAIENSLGVKK